MTLHRIVVVGTTGSGKTTLARQISERLGLPHVELDALFWRPNWTETPNDEFRAAVDRATSGDCWVVDGNYSRSRDIVWSRAETIVWLDYSLALIMWRLWWRVLRRGLRREELWNGNRERLWEHFVTRDSLFLWALTTYRRRRRDYPMLLTTAEYSHLSLVRLASPRQTEMWLAGL